MEGVSLEVGENLCPYWLGKWLCVTFGNVWATKGAKRLKFRRTSPKKVGKTQKARWTTRIFNVLQKNWVKVWQIGFTLLCLQEVITKFVF